MKSCGSGLCLFPYMISAGTVLSGRQRHCSSSYCYLQAGKLNPMETGCVMEPDLLLDDLNQIKLWPLLLLLPPLFFLPLSPPHLFLSFLVSHSLSSLLLLPFPLLPLRIRITLCSSDWPVEICSPSWLSFSEASRLARVLALHHQDPKTC